MTDLATRAAKIKLLILDVDGVLTDNRLFYGDNGVEYKSFYTRDGHAMVLWRKSGLDLGVITGRKSQLVANRMNDLKVKYLFQGVPDKLPVFEQLLKDEGLNADEIAYMGDDILDLPILTRVGLASCPQDADPEVIKRVHFVSEKVGGQGAVRELIEMMLKAQGHWQAHMDFYLR
ncbi:KdsC family phosphatase [Thiomicrospira cyclica]|jgi:3-deoxy-D-manno-octulosonate 8-phosphate phosphatase (KDO 8-P phosphatase)|uniref:3-deoxy-D-manno-octulosonate 8-phosphate phosphatase KdsC n=1 Tax=Thiomicrospira cyclica (strain DSM 14477 / JCM 11371 / ALM1) TaxID=717773 RepID=F6DBD1_THICA|nr:HAD hydrolase family protein [Thiomicrospira cyclica]AEG31239.1 3-deoxy-D-manno-octulosonate 8-phosphate phosphatase, YrbI family [Thiomicrospira cyclica ALM1]